MWPLSAATLPPRLAGGLTAAKPLAPPSLPVLPALGWLLLHAGCVRAGRLALAARAGAGRPIGVGHSDRASASRPGSGTLAVHRAWQRRRGQCSGGTAAPLGQVFYAPHPPFPSCAGSPREPEAAEALGHAVKTVALRSGRAKHKLGHAVKTVETRPIITAACDRRGGRLPSSKPAPDDQRGSHDS